MVTWVGWPEVDDDLVRRTADLDCHQFLEVADAVGVEADLQRLESVDRHSTAGRLHVDEPTERRVGQADVKLGRDKAAVGQRHLVLVLRPGKHSASVEAVQWQLQTWGQSVGTDRQRQASLSTSHVTEYRLHTITIYSAQRFFMFSYFLGPAVD